MITFNCHRTQSLYNQLVDALDEAKEIHAAYENKTGEHDKNWSLYYTGHAYGRIGNLIKVVNPREFQLSIETIPYNYQVDYLTWSEQAAWYIVDQNVGGSCSII